MDEKKKKLDRRKHWKKKSEIMQIWNWKKRFLWKIHIIMHFTVPDESFKTKVILGFVEYIMYNCL